MTNKIFKISYSLSGKAKSIEQPVNFWFALPPDNQYQKLVSYSFNMVPDLEYSDDQGNNIFKFSNGKNSLNFNAELKLELKTNVNDQYFDNNLSRFLIDEAYLEQTPAIINTLNKTVKLSDSDLEKLQKIFHYIIKNFEYKWPVDHRGVKNLNLQKLEGDCAEYASLLVTMCRIAGIPAKNQTGLVIFSQDNSINEHGWASVYLKDLGWIDVDPQYGSLEATLSLAEKIYLGNRPEERITFTNGFNIDLKTKEDDTNFMQTQVLQPVFVDEKLFRDISYNFKILSTK